MASGDIYALKQTSGGEWAEAYLNNIENYSLWIDMSGTFASASTFTYTCLDNVSADADAKKMIFSLFTCTDSAGTTRRYGYVKSVSRTTTTMTVTVVTTSDLASGDKDFRVAPALKTLFQTFTVNVPEEQVADASNQQGIQYLDLPVAMILISTNLALRVAASGTGAACTVNFYENTTALYSTALAMSTNATMNDNRPTTTELTAGNRLSLRVTAAAGATTMPLDLQAKCFMAPKSWFEAS